MSDQRIKTAEEFYLKGLSFNPRNHALLYDIGKLYEGTARLEEALKYYQQIIGDKNRESPNDFQLLNAYERSGLCCLEMSKACEDAAEREKLVSRAEDMFMSSLLECRKGVAHLPKVSASRANLWDSYPTLLSILRQSDHRDTNKLQKEATVHEAVGKHLEAVKVYQEVMMLARNKKDRTGALLGSLRNHLR